MSGGDRSCCCCSIGWKAFIGYCHKYKFSRFWILTKVVASFHNFNLKLEEKANNLKLNFRGWKKNILSLCLVCGWLGYQRARSITWVGRTHKGKCKAFSTIKVKLGQNYLLSVPEKGFLDILHFHFLSFRDPSHLFWWNPINNSIKLMRVTLLHKSTPQF